MQNIVLYPIHLIFVQLTLPIIKFWLNLRLKSFFLWQRCFSNFVHIYTYKLQKDFFYCGFLDLYVHCICLFNLSQLNNLFKSNCDLKKIYKLCLSHVRFFVGMFIDIFYLSPNSFGESDFSPFFAILRVIVCFFVSLSAYLLNGRTNGKLVFKLILPNCLKHRTNNLCMHIIQLQASIQQICLRTLNNNTNWSWRYNQFWIFRCHIKDLHALWFSACIFSS